MPSKPGAAFVITPSASTVKGMSVSMPALTQCLLVRGPDVVVVGTVPGRRVHEAGARVVGDVIAVEERNVEIVAELRERMPA